MTARTLMIQGTSSSAGKSLLVTALCRIYARRGLRVAPFKAQNMSNNAAVCPDGSEIGRAQYVQALAAGIEPQVEINPVLIKPEADTRAQVILMGRPLDTFSAQDYYQQKDILWDNVRTALESLRQRYDLVIIEGAGSPAEINLRAGDIVNMAVALYANSPVLLVGDIDRGGIFAQLLGTLWLLEPEERALVRGLVINKFRGDLALFGDGVQLIEEKGGTPVLGIVPYLKDLYIPEEDAVALDRPEAQCPRPGVMTDIAVIHLPLISNFDDFDPFNADPGVSLRYVNSLHSLGEPDAIILPGTKSTAADLEWLHATGLAGAIIEHVHRGVALAGICGGYQMLGELILDPHQVESDRVSTPGLGLLPIQTHFASNKATYQAQARINFSDGWLAEINGLTLDGYEIHMGLTQGNNPWLEILTRNGQGTHDLDGAISPDGRVWGSYLHGLFASRHLRRAWLRSLGWESSHIGRHFADDLFPEAMDRLADTVEGALDMQRLEKIIWGN
jgi:adenosylcobyric acid synthase